MKRRRDEEMRWLLIGWLWLAAVWLALVWLAVVVVRR